MIPLTCADLSDHVCTGGDGAPKHHPAGGQAAHLSQQLYWSNQ